MTKRVPLSECHRDQAVSDLFVADKLDRAAAWANVRTLMRQVSAMGIDKPWDRSVLPPGVIARPLKPL